jgi:phospholipase/carboxylesterase
MPRPSASAAEPRIAARPGVPHAPALEPGLHRVGRGWLAVPAGASPERARPLVVALHGAGSTGRAMVELLGGAADRAGALLLAPDSAGRTWDLIEGGFGPDVAAIGEALLDVYARWSVDPAATTLAGFSDGASYALSLGVANGEAFPHLVAFSPGFVRLAHGLPRPRIYVAHGREDRVLPIDRCGRRVAHALSTGGYDVHYVEFPGGHTVPPAIVEDAVSWVRRSRGA